MPSYHLDDIDERDLSEAPRLAKEGVSVGAKCGMVAGALLFLGIFVYGSFPALSPEEIVAMDDYQGEQPTRHIFNIQSLEDEAAKPSVAVAEPADAGTDAVNDAVQLSSADSLPIAATEPVPQIPEPQVPAPEAQTPQAPVQTVSTPVVAESEGVAPDPEPQVVQTVESSEPVEQASPQVADNAPQVTPVSASVDTPSGVIRFSTSQQERVIAARATTPAIEESADTIVVASVAALEPVPVPVGSATLTDASNNGNRGRFLPLRTVLGDATQVKANPSAQSKTVLLLDSGVILTVFEQQGDWIHVGTNDGSSITGYVLDSALGKTQANP